MENLFGAGLILIEHRDGCVHLILDFRLIGGAELLLHVQYLLTHTFILAVQPLL